LFAVRRWCKVSGAAVSEDFLCRKLLAFAMQLHHRAEVNKNVSREEALCGICRFDFEAFGEMK